MYTARGGRAIVPRLRGGGPDAHASSLQIRPVRRRGLFAVVLSTAAAERGLLRNRRSLLSLPLDLRMIVQSATYTQYVLYGTE